MYLQCTGSPYGLLITMTSSVEKKVFNSMLPETGTVCSIKSLIISTVSYCLMALLIVMLWFHFILGFNSIFLCVKLTIIHYHIPKQGEITEPQQYCYASHSNNQQSHKTLPDHFSLFFSGMETQRKAKQAGSASSQK